MTESTFSNYLDVGVAARIALKFHRLREANPELFQSRVRLSVCLSEAKEKRLRSEGSRETLAA